MLTLVATADYLNTFKPLHRYVERERRPRLRSYEWLFRQPAVRSGTWVFTDIERLSPVELANASAAAAALRAAGATILNDPARVLCRADLLARLHAAGLNRFRAYPAAAAPRPERFPVLLKSEIDHRQSHHELIRTQAELDAALERLMADGTALRDMLVIEFCNEPVREDVYRKHSVFRVGDAFLSHTLVAERGWLVKYGTKGLSTDAELDDAVAEMEQNPHAAVMRTVFDLAGIDYGRSDFGVLRDGVAVYEINTNPVIPGRTLSHRHAAYRAACDAAAVRIREAIVSLPRTSGPMVRMPWAQPLRLRFAFGPYFKLKRP